MAMWGLTFTAESKFGMLNKIPRLKAWRGYDVVQWIRHILLNCIAYSVTSKYLFHSWLILLLPPYQSLEGPTEDTSLVLGVSQPFVSMVFTVWKILWLKQPYKSLFAFLVASHPVSTKFFKVFNNFCCAKPKSNFRSKIKITWCVPYVTPKNLIFYIFCSTVKGSSPFHASFLIF